MTTLNQALRQVAATLKDLAPGQEFSGWPQDLLLQWFNEGVCILAAWRPDLFSATRVVTLQPGSEQTVSGCDRFGRVISQVNPDGTETNVRKTSFAATASWTKPPCRKQVADYALSSYRFDPTQKRTFYVEPPVPGGAEVKVRIVCSGAPPALEMGNMNDEVDLDCYQFTMVKHYMLAMAYSQDSDSSNNALAQFHLSIWTSFMTNVARSDAAFSGSAQPAPAQQGSR